MSSESYTLTRKSANTQKKKRLGKIPHEAFIKKHVRYTDSSDLKYTTKELYSVLKDVREIISAESSLLEVPAPCVIVGDIHGQYEDLHRIFVMTGAKGRSGALCKRYVFLGDYVDRGPHSLECICCLFGFKIAFPKMFNMLRGNHETAIINKNYGFFQELKDRFSDKDSLSLWTTFNEVFDMLPIAALVHKRILCMHGGISPHLTSLNDIINVRRPVKNMEQSPLVCDLLWSDPVIDLIGYVPNKVRGVSVCFGEDSVISICNKLKLDMIVRAHQMMPNGFGFFCKRKMATVFSAPRYDPEKNNAGAVMTLSKNLKAGFILLAPVDEDAKGKGHFMRNFTKLNSEACYTSKESLNQNSVTQFDKYK